MSAAPAEVAIGTLLRRIADGIEGERVSVGALIGGLGARAHGLALLLFAAPNLTPGPSMPGFSTVFAVPLVIVAVQQMLGLKRLWLPRFVTSRTLSRVRCVAIVERMGPLVVRIDRVLRPRLGTLTLPAMERLWGAVALLLAVLLLVPLPFYPLLPSFTMVVLALGLLARDGVVVAAAGAMAALSVLALAALVWFAGYLFGLT